MCICQWDNDIDDNTFWNGSDHSVVDILTEIWSVLIDICAFCAGCLDIDIMIQVYAESMERGYQGNPRHMFLLLVECTCIPALMFTPGREPVHSELKS